MSVAKMTSKLFNDTFKCFGFGLRKIGRHANARSFADQGTKVKQYKDMPGLSSLPLIGCLHHFLPVIGEIGPEGQLFDKLGSFQSKYGPIMKMNVFGRAPFVLLFVPEHFDQVYRAEETNPSRPGFETLTYYREQMRKSRYDGVYGLSTAEGAQWRDFRTKVNPGMLKPKTIKLYAPGLEEIANEMVARITNLQNQGDYLHNHFDHEITKWALESIALVGLGSRLGSFDDNLTNDHPASKLMQCSKDMLELVFRVEILPSPWKYFATPGFKKLIQIYDTQWEVSEMYINQAKNAINERGYDIPEEDKSMIEKLLAIDPKVAIMMANEMLLAGIDTVAFSATSLIYRLAVNLKAQEKLRQEIRSKGSNRYLKACLKESLRMWHIIPATVRRTTKKHVVGGYQIPEGVDVMAPNQYLSNLDEYYPRAKEFLPERWLVEKDDPLYHAKAHPMVSLPFGFGVRSCIGRRIAELEIEILMKKLFDAYEVSWEGPPIKLVSRLLNTFEKPFGFHFKPAK